MGKPVMITAFGETKNRSEWASDPRCVATAEGLRIRLASGWDPEKAITHPLREPLHREPPSSPRNDNQLSFVEFAGRKNGRLYGKFSCSCGNVVTILVDAFQRGIQKTCGCSQITHGLYKTYGKDAHRLLSSHKNIMARCYDENSHSWPNYGARGIFVVDEWHDPTAFVEWALSHGYSEELTIDRIDNDGPYCPENCRYNTPKGQANNRRSNRHVTAFGETKTVAQWGDDPRCVVSRETFRVRIQNGAHPEWALTAPLYSRMSQTTSEASQ